MKVEKKNGSRRLGDKLIWQLDAARSKEKKVIFDLLLGVSIRASHPKAPGSNLAAPDFLTIEI